MSPKPKIIKVPDMPFAFGDAHFRVLYGPRNEQGGRELVGVVREDCVGMLEEILERDLTK